MISISTEADMLLCKLDNGCRAQLDELCAHTVDATNCTTVAEDIMAAYENLVGALEACKRQF